MMARYINLDFQKTYDHWAEHLCPYDPMSVDDDDELIAWFDKWIAWVAQSPLLDGTDIYYQYADNAKTRENFDRLSLQYWVGNEHGDEID